MSPRKVERASECNSELASVTHYILNGNWSECKMPAYSCIKNELCVLGKLVLQGKRIVIPEKLRPEVLRLAHEGHQGIVKMKARLGTKVWWPKMDLDAEKICKSCHGCQVVGEFPHPEPVQCTMLPSGPWQDLALDLMGPLPDGQNILVVIGASRPLTGSPMGLPTFFFFFLLPPPNMPFPEAKQNEGNLALTWYFRKTFL